VQRFPNRIAPVEGEGAALDVIQREVGLFPMAFAIVEIFLPSQAADFMIFFR
jgi:hypothetical protein